MLAGKGMHTCTTQHTSCSVPSFQNCTSFQLGLPALHPARWMHKHLHEQVIRWLLGFQVPDYSELWIRSFMEEEEHAVCPPVLVEVLSCPRGE